MKEVLDYSIFIDVNDRYFHSRLLLISSEIFLSTFAKLRKATISFIMTVCPFAWNNSASTDGFSWNFIFEFVRKSVEKFKFYSYPTRITDTLHEDVFTFMKYLAEFFLE